MKVCLCKDGHGYCPKEGKWQGKDFLGSVEDTLIVLQHLILLGMILVVLARDLQVLMAFPTVELSHLLVHLCPRGSRESSNSRRLR